MKQFKYLLTILTSLMLLSPFGWAQGLSAPGDEQLQETYVYHVPLTESNLTGARFRVELAGMGEGDFSVAIAGHDKNGTAVFDQAPTLVPARGILVWDSAVSKTLKVFQSLEIVSDQKLTGTIWIWNDFLGFFNGVTLAEVAQELVLPHIPADVFVWRTTIAVKGVSSDGLNGGVDFGYFDNALEYESFSALEQLHHRAYYLGTPYFSIPIGSLGGDTVALWGRVSSPDDAFGLVGYQTFSSITDYSDVQSCSIEMKEHGDSEGWLGISKVEGHEFSNHFTLTNPNSGAVRVTMDLYHRVPLALDEIAMEDEDTLTHEIRKTTIQRDLFPFDRRNVSLADFDEFEGEAVSVHYRATNIPQNSEIEPEPREIFALNLQFGIGQNALGGNHFVAEPGVSSVSWLGLHQLYESYLEVFNTTDRFQKVDVQISDLAGNEVYKFSEFLPPFESMHQINTPNLRQLLIDAGQLVEENSVLRVDISLETDGEFFTKLTAFQEKDFAIVNPVMIPAPPVVEPDSTPVLGGN